MALAWCVPALCSLAGICVLAVFSECGKKKGGLCPRGTVSREASSPFCLQALLLHTVPFAFLIVSLQCQRFCLRYKLLLRTWDLGALALPGPEVPTEERLSSCHQRAPFPSSLRPDRSAACLTSQDWTGSSRLTVPALPVSGPAGSSANIAKFKSHTTCNQFRKWHRNGIKKPQSQRYKTVRDGPQVPEDEHTLAEKRNKKGLKKAQANDAKAMNASASAGAIKSLVKPKEVKSQNPKGQQPQAQSACLHHSLGVCETRLCRIARGLRLYTQSPRPRLQLQLWLRLP
ncbi:uncharacterized protein LOC118502327 [Phyllostomus discolor]|uniref:Large ribosomal subunit protein eL29 n=1 Tax=Phyllostomus discolor TaxID=89673 RepID=A0A7E6EFI1_9CHIR|nr:uncharacterized protein LOC118502327 [Phyllostomus discolor]